MLIVISMGNSQIFALKNFNEKVYVLVMYYTGIIFPNLPHMSYCKRKTCQTIQIKFRYGNVFPLFFPKSTLNIKQCKFLIAAAYVLLIFKSTQF